MNKILPSPPMANNPGRVNLGDTSLGWPVLRARRPTGGTGDKVLTCPSAPYLRQVLQHSVYPWKTDIFIPTSLALCILLVQKLHEQQKSVRY